MISRGTPKAKAAIWDFPDAEARKHGERNGLDTRVVHAVNDARWVCGPPRVGRFPTFRGLRAEANALSEPPGNYGRKTKTQRN